MSKYTVTFSNRAHRNSHRDSAFPTVVEAERWHAELKTNLKKAGAILGDKETRIGTGNASQSRYDLTLIYDDIHNVRRTLQEPVIIKGEYIMANVRPFMELTPKEQ